MKETALAVVSNNASGGWASVLLDKAHLKSNLISLFFGQLISALALGIKREIPVLENPSQLTRSGQLLSRLLSSRLRRLQSGLNDSIKVGSSRAEIQSLFRSSRSAFSRIYTSSNRGLTLTIAAWSILTDALLGRIEQGSLFTFNTKDEIINLILSQRLSSIIQGPLVIAERLEHHSVSKRHQLIRRLIIHLLTFEEPSDQGFLGLVHGGKTAIRLGRSLRLGLGLRLRLRSKNIAQGDFTFGHLNLFFDRVKLLLNLNDFGRVISTLF